MGGPIFIAIYVINFIMDNVSASAESQAYKCPEFTIFLIAITFCGVGNEIYPKRAST